MAQGESKGHQDPPESQGTAVFQGPQALQDQWELQALRDLQDGRGQQGCLGSEDRGGRLAKKEVRV